MLVKIIRQVVYKPTPHDSFRCYGQLRTRASVVESPGEIEKHENGETMRFETTLKTCGPMETYFPIGATPELNDPTANQMIHDGFAESYQGEQIFSISADDIRRSLAVTQ